MCVVVKRDREGEKMEKTKRIEKKKYYKVNTLTEYTVEEGVEEIGVGAFSWCENLKKVTIPRGVRVFGARAFRNSGLTEVTLREGVKEIGNYAFSSCDSLERVVLVKGIRKFEFCAFAGNKKLTELEIHEGVEEIGWGIVARTSLHTITLPLHPIPRFDDRAFQYELLDDPPLPSLTTLRLRRTYHVAPLSIPFPRITEEDNGQLVRFVKDQQAKYLREELRISQNIYYALFIFKRRSHFLYRKDRGVGKKNPGPFSKRIMGYWFRGNWWRRGAYPIAGALAFRESTSDYVFSDDDDNGDDDGETGEELPPSSTVASSSSSPNWNCSACTFSNAFSADVCAICGTSGPKSTPFWSCTICTLVNPGSSVLCSACRSPRGVAPAAGGAESSSSTRKRASDDRAGGSGGGVKRRR